MSRFFEIAFIEYCRGHLERSYLHTAAVTPPQPKPRPVIRDEMSDHEAIKELAKYYEEFPR